MNPNVLVFEIKLLHVSPDIWRIIELKNNSTLHQLHLVIQAGMGWQNKHLYSFTRKDEGNEIEFILPDPEEEVRDGYDINDPSKFKLKDLFTEPGQTIKYLYDFGDGWEHLITYRGKKTGIFSGDYPCCPSGIGKCPPEDIGGPQGFMEMLAVIESKDRKRIKEYREWLGKPFDPLDYRGESNFWFSRVVKKMR